MTNFIKSKEIFFIILILIIFGGGYYLINKENNIKIKSDNSTFTLVDDKDKILFSEKLGLYPEARTQYEQKLKETEEKIKKGGDKDLMIDNYNNLGFYNAALGDYSGAYDAYIESLKMKDDFRITWMAFGDLLVKMKAYKSAEIAYNKARVLNEFNSASYIKLANLYKILNDNKKVEDYYKLGIEKIKNNIGGNDYEVILTEYVDWLVNNKRHDDAIFIYKEILVVNPDNKDIIERRIENINKLKK